MDTSAQGRPGPAERLLATGVVDREYVAAQAGRTFATDLGAARHLVEHGTRSPHPLIDISTLPDWVRAGLFKGETGALAKFLRGVGLRKPSSPAFDPSRVPGTEAEKVAHPGGALGLFLSTAGPDTPLPGRPELTVGAWREHMLTWARLLEEQRRTMVSRTSETWDLDAEAAWKQQWSQAPLPERRPGDTALVSVVMPVRNREQIVLAALESLTAQTLTDWELVVVDDGSTDATATVLSQWADRDPRIRVLSQEQGGVSAARNRALAAARGRYVAFLDSDNTYRPDFLRLGVAAMHGQGLPAAYAALTQRLTADQDRIVYRAHRGGRADLLVLNHIDLNVLVVERDLATRVGGFDTSLKRWVDHDFVLHISREVEPELLPFLAVDYDNALDTARISTSESTAWQWVVLGQHLVEWDRLRAELPDRVPGRVSVSIAVWNDTRMTVRAVDSLLAHRGEVDLEIVVVDNGSRPDFVMGLAAAFVGMDRVRLVTLPRNLNFAIAANLGFAHGTGEQVVFLGNDTEVQAGWWEPLAAQLADPAVLGAAPLLLLPDETVQTAGLQLTGPDGLPELHLAGLPAADVDPTRELPVPALTATALAMRAADVVALRGFDPIFVNGTEDADLCLRAAQLRPGRFVVEPGSGVTHYDRRTIGRTLELRAPENHEHFRRRWQGRTPQAAPHPEGSRS